MNLAEHAIPAPIGVVPPTRRHAASATNHRLHCRDTRWRELVMTLAELRAAKRCSIRIVDADCGTGELLLCAVHHARTLGFTAIEARGITDCETRVMQARAAAANLRDPAIAITFDIGDVVCAMCEEAEFPADIVIWHGCDRCSDALARAVAGAGHTLIEDPAIAPKAAA